MSRFRVIPKADPKLLTSDKARTSGATPSRSSSSATTRRLHGTAQPVAPDARGDGRFPADQPTDIPPTPDPGQGDTPTPDPGTPCVAPTPAPDPASGEASTPSGSAQDSGSGQATTLGGSDAAALQSQGEVPDTVTPPTCPDGTQPTDGNCCPQPAP